MLISILANGACDKWVACNLSHYVPRLSRQGPRLTTSTLYPGLEKEWARYDFVKQGQTEQNYWPIVQT